MESLNAILQSLDKIQGLSAVALVFITCIVLGYALRFVKSFPNDGIPLCVILWGALFMMFLADARPTTMPLRIWGVRNFLTGLIIGWVAWITHKIVLSKIEDLIGSKIGNMGGDTAGTTFFDKPDPKAAPAPPPEK